VKAREAVFTVVDFETTGAVKGWPEEPWQIGVAEVREGALGGTCDEAWLRVAPGRPFNRYAPGRWGQLRGELAVAETLAGSWPRWCGWFEGRWVAAHNAGTERRVLSRAAPMSDVAGWVDTLALARRALPGLGDWSLACVAEATGADRAAKARCPGRTWHDAFFDATATAAFLVWLLAQDGWRDLDAEALAAVK